MSAYQVIGNGYESPATTISDCLKIINMIVGGVDCRLRPRREVTAKEAHDCGYYIIKAKE